MASDAEIVRCAAPWPGMAARILDALAALGPGTWGLEHICRATPSAISPADAAQVLAGLASVGLFAPAAEDDHWQCDYAPAELRRLSHVLSGADHFRRMRMGPSLIELAVTMPLVPSYLSGELEPIRGRAGGFLSTSDAFLRIARAASRRLVIMTPFIDGRGFQWMRRVFEATCPSCERVAVLRNTDHYAAELGVLHSEWLQALQVSVYDYHLSHGAESGRKLPIETFHAKLIVADESLAYVGSANLLTSSEAVSLETGLLIDGAAAGQVARLVEAVIRIARPL